MEVAALQPEGTEQNVPLAASLTAEKGWGEPEADLRHPCFPLYLLIKQATPLPPEKGMRGSEMPGVLSRGARSSGRETLHHPTVLMTYDDADFKGTYVHGGQEDAGSNN